MEWYSDPDVLVKALRGSRTHWANLPEVPGCDRIVEIRRGGQGVIYRARQISTNRTVAIKVLSGGHFASHASRFRFQREIEFVARLRHPHIVRVYESGVTPEGFLYFVMEYVEGRPVDDPGLEHAGHIRKTLTLFTRICEAVQHAHQHGIIHRDLKPSNILIDQSGAPHILDFGIAKVVTDMTVEEEDPVTVSRTGQFIGSLAWASPEQIEASPERTDLRADVYSLGVILYQLLTGRLPHEISKNLRHTLEEIVTAAPRRPRTLRRDVPGDVETVMLKCLAKSAAHRYQTAGEVGRDIQRFLRGEPIRAKADHLGYVVRKALARHKAVALLMAFMLVLIVGFAVFMAVLYRHTKEAEGAARENLVRAEAVQDFLQDMIASADPCLSPQTSGAIRQIVDRAAVNLGDRFDSHPDVEAELRYIMGSACAHLGRIDEAEVHYRRALALLESIHEGSHPEVAKVLCGLAPVMIGRGLFDDAEAVLQRALAIQRSLASVEDTSIARCLLYLGELRAAQSRAEEAQEIFKRAYAIHRDHPGADNMYMLKTLLQWSNLLITWRSRGGEEGLLDEAEAKIGEALRLLDRNPGENAWARSAALLHLGRVKLGTREYDAALSVFQEAIRDAEEVYGPTHGHTAEIFSCMGHTRYYQEQYGEAEAWYRKALAIHEKLTGRSSAGAARSLWNLAHVRWALEDFEDAEAIFRETVGILREVGEPIAYLLPLSLSRLGQLLGEQGRWERAQPLFEEAMDLRISALGASHALALRAMALLGECLVELERYGEGEKHLLQAYAGFAEGDDLTSLYMTHALTALVKLYTAWEKPEEADRFGALLSEQGAQNPETQN
jgi:tetratricopeptide (TPR) repeat protein